VRLGIKGKQVLGVTSIVGAVVVVLSLMNSRGSPGELEESQAGRIHRARDLSAAREVIAKLRPYQALRSDPGLRSILTSSSTPRT